MSLHALAGRCEPHVNWVIKAASVFCGKTSILPEVANFIFGPFHVNLAILVHAAIMKILNDMILLALI